MANSYTVYNPNDPTQTGFLSALALGESGNAPNAASIGYGGVDLSSAPTDNFGFPLQDKGSNVSSAAGTYQFLHGTYDAVAGELGIHDFSQGSQNEAAWYYAEKTYASKTGGSLYDALKSGDFAGVQTALGSVWPSVFGNASAPGGLAASLAGGQGANVPFPVLTAKRLAAHLRQPGARMAFLETSRTGLSGSDLLQSEALS